MAFNSAAGNRNGLTSCWAFHLYFGTRWQSFLRFRGSVMRLLTSPQFPKCIGPVFTYFVGVAMLAFAAAAETPASHVAQPASSEISEQGGDSTNMKGEPISGSNGQEGTNAPGSPTESSPPSVPAVPESRLPIAPQDAEPAEPKILVVIDKPTQQMKVFVHSVERYTWDVSTGLRGYDTPSGKYTARSMNEIWY